MNVITSFASTLTSYKSSVTLKKNDANTQKLNTHHPTREAYHLTLLTRELQEQVSIAKMPLTILTM